MRFILGVVMGGLVALIGFDIWTRQSGIEQLVPVSPLMRPVESEQAGRNEHVTSPDSVSPQAPVAAVIDDLQPAESEMQIVRDRIQDTVSDPATVRMFQATAWTAFRSESAARGFARMMERELERPFRAVRVSPGHYEVRFQYLAEAEKLDVLDAVSQLAGAGVPVSTPKPSRGS